MITDLKLAVTEVARRLGVTENRHHDGKKAIAKKGADAFPGSSHLTPLEEENRRLRAEVRRLEMDRDILKKAKAFFAALTKWPSSRRKPGRGVGGRELVWGPGSP